MKRYAFVTILALALFPIGCNEQTIAGLVSIVGTSVSTLAAIEQPQNPQLSSKILADTAAAVTAVEAFKTGSPTAEVVQALTLVEDDLAVLPLNPTDTALVNLALGTVQSILIMLPQPAIQAHARTVHPRTVTLAAAPKNAKQYREQWNAAVPPAVASVRLP